MQEPLYQQWKQWDCQTDCRYYCMVDREKEREAAGNGPVKYHGKWPFKRVYGIQVCIIVLWLVLLDTLSFLGACFVAFSVLNLAMHFHGWTSFFILLYNTLPLRRDKKTYYYYASLWHIYALLSLTSWFASAVFHSKRSFDVKDDAVRLMVAAPLLAFVTTHILYLNFYKLDYGWNMQVCVVMAVVQLLLWAIWAGVTRHPSRLAMLLEIYYFPPYYGFLDAHAAWHATTIPLTYIWWSFIRDDGEFLACNQVKRSRNSNLAKKAK
ncbi:post-GPI attachment to proteins factor 3-like [Pyrus ussuriensis x Pyrus communis]|uniref:Post-GPI attachment to proteins factor 3 n=1 Tax=Pyrus ussuriensis x Pyrus communis TaxID=2448454 RepID=A0A5N5ICE1_9ROSA|nr:post-GPI attachment to proteins factor 3-like [Pyrus ussuriensis x Pyrus communis]